MALINKEEKNRFLFALPTWFTRFIPHLHLIPQALVISPGKNDRLIFDGSFAINADSEYVNNWTNKVNEPPLVFPASFIKHLTRIYNLRITYPSEDILLWDDDVSSAFRWIKLHPDIASVFAFAVDKFMFIPTGQTFGSNTSPSNWEVLAQARTLIGEIF